MGQLSTKIKIACEYIQARSKVTPEIAVILGSGLGALADKIEQEANLLMKDILHFPESTVEGHAGRLILGELAGKKVVAMQGRYHFYEGLSMQEIVFPVRVMKHLGAKTLIVSNAAGGVNELFQVGDLMLIKDHINLMGDNPLIGINDEALGPRFPDMSQAYTPKLQFLAKEAADELGIKIREGVYLAVSGPNYETPAELKFMRTIGADAVGMSTVPEVIAAVHCGMNILGISCITDIAAAEKLEELDHEKVLAAAKEIEPKFISLVSEVIKRI